MLHMSLNGPNANSPESANLRKIPNRYGERNVGKSTSTQTPEVEEEFENTNNTITEMIKHNDNYEFLQSNIDNCDESSSSDEEYSEDI